MAREVFQKQTCILCVFSFCAEVHNKKRVNNPLLLQNVTGFSNQMDAV